MTTKEMSSDSSCENGSSTYPTMEGHSQGGEVTSAAFCLRYTLGDEESLDKVMGFIVPRALPQSTAAFYAVGRRIDTSRIVEVVFITRRYQRPSYVSDPKRWAAQGAIGKVVNLKTPDVREKRETFISDCVSRMSETPYQQAAGSAEDIQVELARLLQRRRGYHRYRDRRRKVRPRPLPLPSPPSEMPLVWTSDVEAAGAESVVGGETSWAEDELQLLCQFIVDDVDGGLENNTTEDEVSF